MEAVYSRIQSLRTNAHLTQSELAKRLGVTRACVNAWEMGISNPSIKCLISLASLFDVSVDYILGVDKTSSIPLDGLDEEEIKIIYNLTNYFKRKNDGKS